MSAPPRLALHDYHPPGPVGARDFVSNARVTVIIGPVGSGKTTLKLMKFLRRAMRQQPSPHDGIRRTRWVIVRDTYRQLWRTTIRSWWKIMPKSMGKWTGGEDQPATHELWIKCPDGSVAHSIFEFVAIGENSVEDIVGGYEATGFYLNEAHRLHMDVLTYTRGRLHRYPETIKDASGNTLMAPTWSGIEVDMNAPEVDSDWYEHLVEHVPADTLVLMQPGGRDPAAENLRNLPDGYYEDLIVGQPDWWVRRFVDNLFGVNRDGDPVHPEFNRFRHVAPSILRPEPSVTVHLGLDGGLHGAGTFKQWLPSGKLRIVDTVMHYGDAWSFSKHLMRVMAERYQRCQIVAHADPANAAASATAKDRMSWIQIVAKETGLTIREAPSNALSLRLAATTWTFKSTLDDGSAMAEISPHCKDIIKAYEGGYRIKKKPNGERGSEPEKNQASHLPDSDQYANLGLGIHHVMQGRRRPAETRVVQRYAISDQHPQGVFTAPAGGQRYAAGWDRS